MSSSPFREVAASGREQTNGPGPWPDVASERAVMPGQAAVPDVDPAAPDVDGFEVLLKAAPKGVRPLIREPRAVPRSGFRRVVHVLSGGLVNPGPGAAERRVVDRRARIAQRMERECHVTTYVCLKGGIGKTSTAIGVSKTMAQIRPDSTLYVDFNPDAGDGAERTVGQTLRGVTQLAAHAGQVTTVGELNRFLATDGRLTVLPGEPDPRLGESVSSGQVNAIVELTSRFFANIHLDSGTGMTHPCMPGILGATDTVVVPAAYSITGARRAADTIQWLDRNGYPRLAASAVVALTEAHRVSTAVDKQAVRDLFPGNPVVCVPQDPHVADGARIRMELMQARTRDAYAEIAALVADQFARPGPGRGDR